ncbi:MAG: hypothetical protein H0T85_00210 [Geodermatophilaceae bacterium]|nr:hypothetical protein [Geodermatophilaceae bacterium]
MIPNALDVSTMSTASLVIIGALALVALAVLLLAGKLVLKLVVVALVVVLAVAVYDQRSALADCPQTCSCSFFGYDVGLGDGAAADACRGVVGGVQGPVP